MEINLTFLIQIINIFFSVFLLKKFLVKPVIESIKTKINNLKVLVDSANTEKELYEQVKLKKSKDFENFVKQSEPLLKSPRGNGICISSAQVDASFTEKKQPSKVKALASQKEASAFSTKILDLICDS